MRLFSIIGLLSIGYPFGMMAPIHGRSSVGSVAGHHSNLYCTNRSPSASGLLYCQSNFMRDGKAPAPLLPSPGNNDPAASSDAPPILASCLWKMMPFPFVTAQLSLRDTFPSPPLTRLPKACNNVTSCPVITKWRALLYHPDHDSIISGSMFRGGGNVFESSFRPILLRYLKTQADPLVLDVGANIGLHTLWLTSQGYRTHSFEPLKRNFALLHCSLIASPAAQPFARVNNFGLGSSDIEACMTPLANNLGGTSIKGLPLEGCAPTDIASVRTLDWYWETVLKKEQVFLMKIDVEGFEAHVVAGALKMFTQSPPLVVTMEYFADMIDNAGSFNSTELLTRMHGFGYVLHDPWGNRTRPVTDARQAIDADKSTWAVFDNLVMVHSSHLGTL